MAPRRSGDDAGGGVSEGLVVCDEGDYRSCSMKEKKRKTKMS